MRTPARRHAAALAVLALSLAACGGDDADPGATTDPSPTSENATGAPADDPTVEDTPTDDASAAPESTPTETATPVDGCTRLEEADDGIYAVGEAGELTMTRTDTELTVDEVRPADGWSHTEDEHDDPDEVEVTFTSGEGREIEFEAEIDDGQLEIDVCDD